MTQRMRDKTLVFDKLGYECVVSLDVHIIAYIAPHKVINSSKNKIFGSACTHLIVS